MFGIGYIRDSSLIITLVYNKHYLVLSRNPLEKKRYSSLAVGIVWESSTIEASGFMWAKGTWVGISTSPPS